MSISFQHSRILNFLFAPLLDFFYFPNVITGVIGLGIGFGSEIEDREKEQ